MKKLFVYQTLRDKKIQRERLGRTVYSKPAYIPDFKEINTIGNYHNIIPSDGNEVKGDILFLNDNDLDTLDEYEERYKKIRIKAHTKDSQELVWVYVLK